MRLLIAAIASLALLLPAGGNAQTEPEKPVIDLNDYDAMRKLLVSAVREHIQATARQTGVSALDDDLLDAIAKTPRHEFVPPPLRKLAYLDIPLPLGHKQNISQPFLIALMTQLVRVRKQDVVFETGTGAGYQAAILTHLADRVYSVEVVEPLAKQAKERLARLGYDGVEVKRSDGYYGWPEKGPFDVIIVKEAVHHIPPPLLNQLKPGGRMVAPVGPLGQSQTLKLITKGQNGQVEQRDILPVRFAPLQGGERI
ncbi:MAG: protein-L-isoaspartate(D-aspartate) O-methyltransferase [Alphaproteobacteria bacterium]|nr:protein-L-isoaspartate(D-aspartate) O-methyltransferase [Alphaproteobacteria bacterium]